MQKKKLIITLIYAVLSIFMITACSDSNNGSNNSGNNGGDGSVLPGPKPDPNAVKEFYHFTTWNNTLRLLQDSLYAILDNGSLYAWGNNKDGQLGLGLTDEYVAYNKKVDIPGKVKLIKCAGNSLTGSACYVITEDGALYVWGKNSYGQLGVGNEVNKNTPIKVTAINGKVMELIISNSFSVYAILEDGSLYAWGNNSDGQLGVGDEENRNTPTKVNLPSKIKELIITGSSVYALMEDSSLYSWGYNLDGQLGVGDEVNKNTPTKVNLPGKIKELITTGSSVYVSVYALMEDSSLYSWGSNESGQLGVGDEVNKNTPTKVNLPSKIKELITTGSSVYALMEDSSLYSWGENNSGELGVGDEVNKNTPTKVNLPGKIKELITTNGSSVYALMEDSSLYSWGYNSYGQLGVGDKIDKNTPTIVNLPGKIKKLITSSSASYAILEDGSLYAWGYNYYGELGVGSNEDKNTPTKVTAINGKIMDLIINSDKDYSTYKSIFAIIKDGSLYAWGNNKDGQLGIGSREDNINSPTKVTDINGKVTKVMTFIYVYEEIFGTYVDASTYILTESSSLYTTYGWNTFEKIIFN